MIRCDRQCKRCGGVALLVRKPLCPALVFRETVLNAHELLCCDLHSNNSLLRFIVVYKVPNGTSALSVQMSKAISDLVSSNRTCILCGDFNMPDINWASNSGPIATTSPSNFFLKLCADHCLTQYVTSKALGDNTLDLVLCNDKFIIKDLAVRPPVGSSDHSSNASF